MKSLIMFLFFPKSAYIEGKIIFQPTVDISMPLNFAYIHFVYATQKILEQLL